jgi:hypothetical protein
MHGPQIILQIQKPVHHLGAIPRPAQKGRQFPLTRRTDDITKNKNFAGRLHRQPKRTGFALTAELKPPLTIQTRIVFIRI